jgi:hypothetical protein
MTGAEVKIVVIVVVSACALGYGIVTGDIVGGYDYVVSLIKTLITAL